MIRLIIEYTETDGCTYSSRETIPILYESRNKLHRDFEAWCINDRDEGLYKKFMKTGIESDNFLKIVSIIHLLLPN